MTAFKDSPKKTVQETRGITIYYKSTCSLREPEAFCSWRLHRARLSGNFITHSYCMFPGNSTTITKFDTPHSQAMNTQINNIQRADRCTMGSSQEDRFDGCAPLTRRSTSRIYLDSPSIIPERQLRSCSAPQLHQLTPDARVGGARLFDLFYSIIFSLVHVTLTAVLSPVLGNKAQQRHQRRSRPSTESSMRSLPPIMGESDPELAMSGVERLSGRGSASYQPILKTQGTSRRFSGDNVPALPDYHIKSVHFPAPERARPPLGRIGLTSSSVISSASGSTASNSTSSKSDSRRGRPCRLTPQTSSSRSNSGTRFASSPFNSSRMAHSTYFLE